MADEQVGGLAGIDLDEGRQRHLLARQRRGDVELVEQRRVLLQLRRHFQHHVIAVGLGEVLRDLALADRVVQRRVDQCRRNAEARRPCAVDRQRRRRGRILLVRRHVGQFRHAAQALEQARGPGVELVEVGVGHRVLVLRARQPAADVDVLRRLHEQIDALQLRHLRAQARNHLVGAGGAALVLGPEGDEEDAGVGGVAAGEHAEAGHVRVAPHHVGDQLHALPHRRERGVLRGLGEAVDRAGVLLREETLGAEREHHDAQCQGGEEHAQRRELMPEHELEPALVAAPPSRRSRARTAGTAVRAVCVCASER